MWCSQQNMTCVRNIILILLKFSHDGEDVDRSLLALNNHLIPRLRPQIAEITRAKCPLEKLIECLLRRVFGFGLRRTHLRYLVELRRYLQTSNPKGKQSYMLIFTGKL